MDNRVLMAILMVITQALPTLLVVALVAAVLRWSPFGRAFLAGLRKPAIDEAAVRQVVGEIAALRQELSEVQERLDFSERLLAARHDTTIHPPPNVTLRIPTPV